MVKNFLSDLTDFAFTAKAWAAGVVVAIGEVVTLVQVAVSDDAISLDEAKGIYLAATQVVTLVVAVYAVWRARNKPVKSV
jgi:hypothetical protein